MKIESLEAGRNLDELIAGLVMGWKDLHLVQCPKCGAGLHGKSPTSDSECIPKYSTDIAAAWAVVKIISCHRDKERHIYKPVIRLEYYEHDGIHSVTFGRCKGIQEDETDIYVQQIEEPGGDNIDKAMCLAICKMALLAVGYGESKAPSQEELGPPKVQRWTKETGWQEESLK